MPYAALLVKVDSRKEAAAKNAIECLEGFGIKVLNAQIPLLSAFEQAESQGVTVIRRLTNAGVQIHSEWLDGLLIARPAKKSKIYTKSTKN